MSKYDSIVISVIDRDGEFHNVEASKDYMKHYFAFSKLFNKSNFDFSDNTYYNENIKDKCSITGFDIAKFLCAEGYAVFFQSDVHNFYHNKRVGSLLFPTNATIALVNAVSIMLEDLNDYDLYIGTAKYKNPKKKKIIYQTLNKGVKIECKKRLVEKI